jgi:hypothetical protein
MSWHNTVAKQVKNLREKNLFELQKVILLALVEEPNSIRISGWTETNQHGIKKIDIEGNYNDVDGFIFYFKILSTMGHSWETVSEEELDELFKYVRKEKRGQIYFDFSFRKQILTIN